MKVFLVFLVLVALGSSAPQPRKLFHEHVDDFIEIIIREVQSELDELVAQYSESEEFQKTLQYVTTSDFKQLIYEMEALPEFKAMLDFLERDNIDIMYFIDLINGAMEGISVKRSRQSASGSDMSSYMNDVIALLPKDILAALFEQKMAEDVEFRVAMENLQSDEWQQILSDLFENATFQKEVQILSDNGVDINLFITEIMAVFGQN